jgi:RsiW-degrading membrane proteinase PrsW (M82 family)
MAFPSYRLLTQHGRKLGVLAMIAGAAYFTLAATLIEANNIPDDSKKAWLLMGSALLLFFGCLLWLIVDSCHNGRDWSELVITGCSSGGTAIGISRLLFDIKPLVILGLATCAWAITVIVIVSRDSFREYSDYYEREARREESIPEYAIGTPRDPAWHGHGRNAQSAGGAVEMTSSLPDGQADDPGSKV